MTTRGFKLIEIVRPDGEMARFFEPEDVASGVDLGMLDEARSVAEGDADTAELMELLGVGKAEAVRRAVRFTLTEKKKQGGK